MAKRKAKLNKQAPVIVGIGASAGGLEALQEFFKAVPMDSQLAYVVIQHLSPDYRSLMDELLARQTRIPIHIARDNMKIQPNNIYLIPPRKNMTLLNRQIILKDQAGNKGLNLPVDIFLQSLAEEMAENAIGVILSGTGSDGTLGVRAIKEAGGMVIVQDEATAKFDGMPRNAASTGLVDYILPPSKMPEALINYVKHPFTAKELSSLPGIEGNESVLTKIISLLKKHCGVDFSFYKENTVIRRLERRISVNRFQTLEEYLSFLSESEKEKEILYKEMLIGVTRFFRDNEAFEKLKQLVLPQVFKTKDKNIRIWSTGCSTGEEVYSLAILCKEYLEKHELDFDIKIFATDIDKHALEIAGAGYYPESIVSDIHPELLSKYFTRQENGYQIHESIRKMIVFARHNLIKDPPFSKLQLLICRNLFIYLKQEMQARLLAMFYYSLSPSGYLFLGSSESLGEYSDAFRVVDTKWKIFSCNPGYKPPVQKHLPYASSLPAEKNDYTSAPSFTKTPTKNKLNTLLEKTLTSILPPTILIDDYDQIIHIINNINPYLALKSGDFSQNLYHHMHPELAIFTSALIRQVKREKRKIISKALKNIKGYEKQCITIEGNILSHDDYNLYAISFTSTPIESQDTSKKEKGQTKDINSHAADQIYELEKELQYTKENLQATVEELETSNEELQSSNEELIASNEELQSTNEELQSLNEELYTVNAEHQTKIEELTRLNNDVNNLLKNTEIGALYLDTMHCIRKVTPVVSSITNILPSDLGRPISHITVMDHYPEIMDDIDKVTETLQAVDREILSSDETKTYYVRIRPYRTEYNAIEGVLLVFVDITQLKNEQHYSHQLFTRLQNALAMGKMAWWEWDVTSNRVLFDDRKATMLGYTPEEFPTDVYEICQLIHPEDYENTMQVMRDHLEGKTTEWNTIYRIKCKDGQYTWYHDRGAITERDPKGNPKKLIGTVIEVNQIKDDQELLYQQKQILESILDNSPLAKTLIDKNGQITYANKRAEEVFGITQKEVIGRTYNARSWKITDEEGKTLPAEKLPFARIKKEQKPLFNFRHYIEFPDKRKVLLRINGAPIHDSNGNFTGASFTIEAESKTTV